MVVIQALTAVSAVPLIVALVSGAKRAGLVDGPRSFLLALALGLLAGAALIVESGDYSGPAIIAGITAGLGIGLAASGGYSGAKSLRKPKPAV